MSMQSRLSQVAALTQSDARGLETKEQATSSKAIASAETPRPTGLKAPRMSSSGLGSGPFGR